MLHRPGGSSLNSAVKVRCVHSLSVVPHAGSDIDYLLRYLDTRSEATPRGDGGRWAAALPLKEPSNENDSERAKAPGRNAINHVYCLHHCNAVKCPHHQSIFELDDESIQYSVLHEKSPDGYSVYYVTSPRPRGVRRTQLSHPRSLARSAPNDPMTQVRT